MPSFSPNLGLYIFSDSDTFNLTQYDDNWSILDDYPGNYICASTTRPGSNGGPGIGGTPAAWGAAQKGQKIVETDTGLTWSWSGTAFVRDNPKGSLGRVTTSTTVATTSSWSPSANGTFATAISELIQVPNGGRQLMIVAEVPEVTNVSGSSYLLITRTISSTATILNSWPVPTHQQVVNSNFPGTPGSFSTFDIPGSASATYSLCFAVNPAFGGTTSLIAGFSRPISLTVIEL